MTWRIEKSDCLEFLTGLEPDSASLVLGSPPYENQRTYGIDFDLAGEEWVSWMVKVVQASLRVCTGLVAFVVEGKTKDFQWSATPALLMADLHRAGVCLRKPPIFHRVGIPGSGGPDWLRNDTEIIICATRGGKLPWSDNTTMGHAPKWAPGGEMSHRVSDGSRVSHRDAHGFTDGGGRGRNADGTKKKTKRIVRGMKNGDTVTADAYLSPVLANPGNVIHYTPSETEIILFLEEYADAFDENQDEILQSLQAAIRESEASFWILGISKKLCGEKILQSILHGRGKGHPVSEIEGGGERSLSCPTAIPRDTMLQMQKQEKPGSSSRGRKSDKQSAGEHQDSLSELPQYRAPSCQKFDSMSDLRQETSLRRFVRGSLLSIQKAWRSAEEMHQQSLWDCSQSSDLIHCLVGGGVMGSKLAHLSEAPYPESLCEFFIRSFCRPGGLVVDPFSGSGTTGAVAVRWRRNFLGCDIRQNQVDLTRRRIEAETPMMEWMVK